MSNGKTAFVNEITNDTVVPTTLFVVMLAPAGSADKSGFNTFTALTLDWIVYDMSAVYEPALIIL